MTRKPNFISDTYDLSDIDTRAKSWADETDMFKKKRAKGPRTDKRFNGQPYFCALCGNPARFPPHRGTGKGSGGCLQHRLETKKQAMARSQVERAKEALAREFDPEHPSRNQVFTERMLGDMMDAYSYGVKKKLGDLDKFKSVYDQHWTSNVTVNKDKK